MEDKKKDTGRHNIAVKIFTQKGLFDILNDDIAELYFVEDIFSVYITGKLTFYDKFNALELMSFTGHEYIYVLYGEDNPIQKLFAIYNVANISPIIQTEGTSFSVTELYFTEVDYVPFTQSRHSKSWLNTKVSSIINDIYINMVNSEKVFQIFEETNEKMNFCMPYWTPSEAIRWLMCRVSGKETKTAGYLLFSNSKGFNFTTIEKLFRNRDIEMSEGKVLYYEFGPTDGLYPNKILGWAIDGIDKQSLLGLQGGKKFGYNWATKGLLTKEYTYADTISKYTMFGKKTLFTNISDNSIKLDMDGDSDEKTLENIAHSEFIKRYSKQLSVKITVRGHERRYAGMLASIMWKSGEKEKILNKAMDGKYLVATIVHQFSGNMQPTYRQMLTLIKNAYTDSDFKYLHNATIVDKEIKNKKILK